jgi:regulatory protein
MKMDADESDQIIAHLIKENFLNEAFACSFARGKHRIKHWGTIRITNELKFENKSAFNCHSTEISQEYLETFHTLSERQWDAIRERDKLKKERNCDFYFVKV